MEKNQKYLIQGIIVLAVLTIIWRLNIISGPGEEPFSNILDLILLVAILFGFPLYFGHKISRNKALKYSIVWAAINIIIDRIVLNINIIQNLNSSNEVTREVMANMLSTGEISYYPNIESTIFLLLVYIILIYAMSKPGEKNELNDDNQTTLD
jgi:hypothetical protein